MKKIIPSAIVATLLLLSGCSDSDTSNETSSSKTFSVERGPILGAVVLDADGQQATQDDNATALYTFAESPTYPVTVYGGYIDVNANGVIDAGEVANTVTLKADSGEILTLLKSFLSDVDENS